nr:MKI67 FHA domain-interacting nucleolar phosphoprotein-like [Onthophagus taurus]
MENKGIIYVGHLPHGFYEAELKSYFNQFGKVTRSRVARSPKTGRSKGYGFIEFKHEEVAKIAAETMNNYLMFKRRLIAKVIANGEKVKRIFKGQAWNTKSYSGKVKRAKEIKQLNAYGKGEKNINKRVKNIKKKIEDLKKMGIKHKVKINGNENKDKLNLK